MPNTDCKVLFISTADSSTDAGYWLEQGLGASREVLLPVSTGLGLWARRPCCPSVLVFACERGGLVASEYWFGVAGGRPCCQVSTGFCLWASRPCCQLVLVLGCGQEGLG